MNWLLILVVLLVAGNIVWGFFRGFLRVVYSMAAWILILVFVTFATPYVADWMTEHTGLDTRIEKNCKEKLQNAVAGEEKKYRRTKHAGAERSQRSGNETAGKRMEPDRGYT